MDKFEEYRSGQLDSPAFDGFVIVPDDDNDLAISTRAIYVGETGNLAVVMQGSSSTLTFLNVIAGNIYPIRAKRIIETTTATGLIGLY